MTRSDHPVSVVKVRCVACSAERDVGPGEVPAGEVPMCDECMSPMVAVEASVGPLA